ncbi:hypothetical protein PINS_up006676 [Pythium insidiosum]|nr:hypothetical protein PINS_up006676 [Pythium insidiosum]
MPPESADSSGVEHEDDDDDDADDAKRCNRPPNLRRLQVFRTVMQRLTEAFTVYSPLLAWIQQEYDAVIEHLLAQCQLIPQLHAELESLHTQCLQELSRHQIETKQRHHALRQTLKQTQAKLTAYAAQHTRLTEENMALQAQVVELERRAAEMQQSNVSLVNGIKRHDETIRHIHERSRDEAIALQQITLKYHRAADEIAELKKTIASLEEKVGGVHIAADKATIGVLSRDLQELHAKYIRMSTRCICGVEGDSTASNQYIPTTAVLNRVLVRTLEGLGVSRSLDQLIGMIGARSSASAVQSEAQSTTTVSPTRSGSVCVVPSSSALASLSASALPVSTPRGRTHLSVAEATDAVDKASRQLLQDIFSALQHHKQLQHRNASRTGGIGGATDTFLTEPSELVCFETAHQDLISTLIASDDILPARGIGPDVPEYLQYEGVVRNLYFERSKVEVLITKVWQQKDDQDRARRGASSQPPTSTAKVFFQYLQRMFPSQHDAVECAYNVISSLQRFSSTSTDCRLFNLILHGQLAEEARHDQLRELYAVHDALFAIHREQKDHQAHPVGYGNRRGGGLTVTLSEVLEALRRLFPWKRDSQFTALHHANPR